MTPIPIGKSQIEYSHQDYQIQARCRGHNITHIRMGNNGETIAVSTTWDKMINQLAKLFGHPNKIIKIQLVNQTGTFVVSVRVKDLAKGLISSLSSDQAVS